MNNDISTINFKSKDDFFAEFEKKDVIKNKYTEDEALDLARILINYYVSPLLRDAARMSINTNIVNETIISCLAEAILGGYGIVCLLHLIWGYKQYIPQELTYKLPSAYASNSYLTYICTTIDVIICGILAHQYLLPSLYYTNPYLAPMPAPQPNSSMRVNVEEPDEDDGPVSKIKFDLE